MYLLVDHIWMGCSGSETSMEVYLSTIIKNFKISYKKFILLCICLKKFFGEIHVKNMWTPVDIDIIT